MRGLLDTSSLKEIPPPPMCVIVSHYRCHHLISSVSIIIFSQAFNTIWMKSQLIITEGGLQDVGLTCEYNKQSFKTSHVHSLGLPEAPASLKTSWKNPSEDVSHG